MPNDINHVVVGNETKLDLRQDTVTPSTMVSGIVAHDASGARIVGTFDPTIFVQKSGDTMTGNLECPRVYKNYNAGEYYTEYDLSYNNGLGLRTYADSQSIYGAFCNQARLSSNQLFMSNGDGTNDYPITKSVILDYDGILFEKNNAITKLDESHFDIGGKDMLRLTPHLTQSFATSIQTNADLNTASLVTVGQYWCDLDVKAATLTNCPTQHAFMMVVYAPISASYDDESGQSRWYRVRKILDWQGNEYIQTVYGGGIPTTYGSWRSGGSSTPQTGTATVDGVTWTYVIENGYVDMYADITLNGYWESWNGIYVLRNSGHTTYGLPVQIIKRLVDVTSYVGANTQTCSVFPLNYSEMSRTGPAENITSCDLGRSSYGADNVNYYCRKYIRGLI